MVEVRHLFNSDGLWVGFCQGNYVFDAELECLGWMPWDDGEVVDWGGDYVATVTDDSLLVKMPSGSHEGESAGFPGMPGKPDHPGFPGHRQEKPLPMFAEDFDQ